MSQGFEARLAHHSSLRTRVRVPHRRRDHAFFEEIGKTLGALPGVRSVEVNPLTASILVLHDRDFHWPQTFALEEGPARPPTHLLAHLRHLYRHYNGQVRVSTGGALDLSALLFLFVGGFAIVQAWRGRLEVPAMTLAWVASEIVRLGSAADVTTSGPLH